MCKPFMNIQVEVVRGYGRLPYQAKKFDAGYDLFAIEASVIPPGERRLVRTGIAMAIPQGYYGRIAPRSGLALKNGIDVMGGVVDAGYRGEIGVILLNTDKTNIHYVQQDDKIAQIIIESCAAVEFIPVEHLEESDRKDGGFGSTG